MVVAVHDRTRNGMRSHMLQTRIGFDLRDQRHGSVCGAEAVDRDGGGGGGGVRVRGHMSRGLVGETGLL